MLAEDFAFRFQFVCHELHSDQIDDAAERIRDVRGAFSNRYFNRQGVRAQTLIDLAEDPLEFGTLPVHFVDERDPWNLVLVCLTPNRFALSFNTFPGAEHHHGSVENA